MRPFVVIGNIATHGSVALEGATTTFIEGKQIACVGHNISCLSLVPFHGVCTIITDNETALVDGSAVARHGDRYSCGALLIASIKDVRMV